MVLQVLRRDGLAKRDGKATIQYVMDSFLVVVDSLSIHTLVHVWMHGFHARIYHQELTDAICYRYVSTKVVYYCLLLNR
jgi:hypothetical protein